MPKKNRRQNKVIKVKTKTKSKQTPKIPISGIAKAVANMLGAGGMADGLIDSGVSALAGFTNLPFGIRSNKRFSGKRGSAAAAYRNAPTAIGFAMRTPDWDFNRAPDVGYGPGIRISGRYQLNQIIDQWNNTTTSPQAQIGVFPGPDYSHVMNAFLFSPAAGYPGDNTFSPVGAFGSSDSIHQSVCECFTRYNVVDAVIEFVPTTSSNTGKSVTIAWVSDAEVVGGILNNQCQSSGNVIYSVPLADDTFIRNIPDAVTTSAWMPAQLRLPLDTKQRDLLYVNTEDFQSPALKESGLENTIASEVRFLFPGGFLVTGTGATSTAEGTPTVLGMLFANITMDVYQLALNAEPTFAPGTVSASTSFSAGSTMSTPTPFVNLREEKEACFIPQRPRPVAKAGRYRNHHVRMAPSQPPAEVKRPELDARPEPWVLPVNKQPFLNGDHMCDRAKLPSNSDLRAEFRSEREAAADMPYPNPTLSKELHTRLEGYPVAMDTTNDDYVEVPNSKKRKINPNSK
jgi:hypothetical protein